MKKLFYWIDYSASYPDNTGMQRIARGIARGLLESGQEIIFVLWNPRFRRLVTANREDMERFSRFNGPCVDLDVYEQERFIIPRPMVHGEILLVPEVTYVTVHEKDPTKDLLKYIHNNYLKSIWVYCASIHPDKAKHEKIRIKHINYMKCLQYSDLVLPVSNALQKELTHFFAKNQYDENEWPDIEKIVFANNSDGDEFFEEHFMERIQPNQAIHNDMKSIPQNNQSIKERNIENHSRNMKTWQNYGKRIFRRILGLRNRHEPCHDGDGSMTAVTSRKEQNFESERHKMAIWQDYGKRVFQRILDFRNKTDPYYYYVGHTCTYERNSGIQRVVRSLGQGLVEIGQPVGLIQWDWDRYHQTGSGRFIPLKPEEKQHMARWNGPGKTVSLPTAPHTLNGKWLIIPELLSDPAKSAAPIMDFAHAHGMKVALVFFDAIPYKMPEIYPVEATRAHYEYMLSIYNADLIFPISEFTSKDLKRFFNSHFPDYQETSRNQLKVQACCLPGEFPERERITQPEPLNNDVITILSVGTLEPRKNHIALVNAFGHAVHRSKRKLRLILAGGSHPNYTDEVEKLMSRIPEIEWRSNEDDKGLQALYENCHFTVYPSLEEGFGLPILESIWNGKACICRNTGAMKEVAKEGGCLMVETSSIQALEDAIIQLAENDELRSALTRQATTRKLKTWQEYAQEIVKHCEAFPCQRHMTPSLPLSER